MDVCGKVRAMSGRTSVILTAARGKEDRRDKKKEQGKEIKSKTSSFSNQGLHRFFFALSIKMRILLLFFKVKLK